jgi:hypothetical protein
MALQQLVILTAAAVLFLFGLMRVLRVRRGLEPRPHGPLMFLVYLVILFVPPIALEVITDPTASAGQMHGVESVLLYWGALALFAILMGTAALLVRRFVWGPARAILLVGLVGSRLGEEDIPVDPPISATLARDVELVDVANAVFPRGPAFMEESERPGFVASWMALDEATATLEAQIVEDRSRGLGVSWRALDTAKDARRRLEALRRAAADHGTVLEGRTASPGRQPAR